MQPIKAPEITPNKIDMEEYLNEFVKRSQGDTEGTRTLNNMFPVKPMIPTYKSTAVGDWKLSTSASPVAMKGYLGRISRLPDTKLMHDGTVWMSCSIMELESHQTHLSDLVHVAKLWVMENGDEEYHVVVGGLGMAMFTINVIHTLLSFVPCLRVTVIEKDKDIIELVGKSLTSVSREYWEEGLEGCISYQLNVVNKDIFEIESDELGEVHYLYVDIWEKLGSERALTDTVKIVESINPEFAGYWGQEIDIAAGEDLSKLPIVPDIKNEDYLAMCKEVLMAAY